MGGLRLLLATSVAYGHLGHFLGFPLVPGDTAVQCFYVVSGFYMSLVLNGKYASAGYWTFLSNRMLRIYPTYFIVLLATLLFARPGLPPLDPPGWTFFHASQAVLLGQDAYMFLGVVDGSLAFASDFRTLSAPLFAFAPVPQAWSLGVEMWFYLVAPFILRRSVRLVIGALLASIVLRMGLQFAFGLAGDPWSYRFFPSELALFLLGAVAQRSTDRADFRRLVALAVLVAVVLFINRPHGLTRAASVSFLAAATMAIPYLCALTKNVEADRYLGDLSYPIYLTHMLVGHFVASAPLALMSTAVASAFLAVLDRKIDSWRQLRVKRASSAACLDGALIVPP